MKLSASEPWMLDMVGVCDSGAGAFLDIIFLFR